MNGNIRSSAASFKPPLVQVQQPTQPAEPEQHTPDPTTQLTETEPAPKTDQGSDDLSQMPLVLIDEIGEYLSVFEVTKLARTNKKNYDAICLSYRQRLKPEYRQTKNPCELFGDPGKRLDQFVPIDKTGRTYLGRLEIKSTLAYQCIKKGQMSIQRIASNLESLANVCTEDLDISTRMLLGAGPIQDLVGCERISLTELLSVVNEMQPLQENWMINLYEPWVTQRLYGVLSPNPRNFQNANLGGRT